MKILIIDNNIDKECWGSPDLCRMAQLAPQKNSIQNSIFVRRAPQEDLPKSPLGFDRVIVSGSKTSALEDAPWIDQLLDFINKTIELRIPFLGVCYGHQALARALGGKDFVRKSSTPETGWTKIQILEPSTLFKGLPSSFYSFSAHLEEISDLPSGMKRLAFSEGCRIQACQLENFPVFGIQFHPEKNLEGAKRILAQKSKRELPLLNPHRSEELYNPKIGELLFKNFLES